jgi:hypothetical protein
VAGKEVTLVAAEAHRVHQPLAQAYHLLHLCPYPVERQVVHCRAHALGQLVHLPSCRTVKIRRIVSIAKL